MHHHVEDVSSPDFDLTFSFSSTDSHYVPEETAPFDLNVRVTVPGETLTMQDEAGIDLSARREAFLSMHSEYFAAVRRYSERRVAPSYVDDVVSETWAIAWRRFDLANPFGLPWLYKVAHNVIGNVYKRRSRDLGLVDRLRLPDGRDESTDPRVEDLRLALARLPTKDREVISLAYWEDLTAAEIATVMSTTEEAIWTRLSRAKKKLRANLHDLELAEVKIPHGR